MCLNIVSWQNLNFRRLSLFLPDVTLIHACVWTLVCKVTVDCAKKCYRLIFSQRKDYVLSNFYLYLSVHVSVCVCLWVCVSVCLSCECVSVYAPVYVRVCMCVSVLLCIRLMLVFSCVSVDMCECVLICMYVYVCMCIWIIFRQGVTVL